MKRVTQKHGNVEIGTQVNGWTCVKEYHNFFLWERKTGGTIIRECCFKNECPREMEEL